MARYVGSEVIEQQYQDTFSVGDVHLLIPDRSILQHCRKLHKAAPQGTHGRHIRINATVGQDMVRTFVALLRGQDLPVLTPENYMDLWLLADTVGHDQLCAQLVTRLNEKGV